MHMDRAVVDPSSDVPEAGPYRLVRAADPLRALARAVEYCARHDAFAARPFGHWARVLIGQVNRGHYRFAVEPGGADGPARIVGFAGWFRAGRTAAERWMADEACPDHDPRGDCVVLNAVAADGADVLRALHAGLGAAAPAPCTIFAKRLYPDGRVRPVRLPVAGPRARPEPFDPSRGPPGPDGPTAGRR